MSVKVRLGVGNSFAPVGNQEQFETLQKQSGSNGEGGEGEGDERTQLTGGDGDPQPHHLLCSPTTGTSLIGTRHSSGVTTLLLSTLLTIAAGFFTYPMTEYMLAARL